MWGRLAPLLPPRKPWTGRPALDRRRFLEAVLWLARTGAPWRDLPAELMNWRTAWRRLQRWTVAGVWKRVVDALRAMAPDAGREAHMLDSSVIRAHAHAAGARRAAGGQALGRSRGGFSTKLHLRCDGRGRPVAFHLTGGQRHDLIGVGPLFEKAASRTGRQRAPRRLARPSLQGPPPRTHPSAIMRTSGWLRRTFPSLHGFEGTLTTASIGGA